MGALLESTSLGLYCAAGDFHIDPWGPAECAVITHAHSDHARAGSKLYLTSRDGAGVLRLRVDPGAAVEALPYGEIVHRNGVALSFHPAGHILGSAQVRIEYRGEVWVVSGDYKLENDGLSGGFERLRCHTFVTESTFGLPIYRWRPQAEVFAEINRWWQENGANGCTSVLFGYSLGKAQRLLAGVDSRIGPIWVHDAVARFLPAYAAAGVKLPPVERLSETTPVPAGALVIAPPSAEDSPLLRRIKSCSTAAASGWMRLRGARQRRGLSRGFVLSDHVDWTGLQNAISATGAEKIYVTHGYTRQLVRWLNEKGLAAEVLPTFYESETPG